MPNTDHTVFMRHRVRPRARESCSENRRYVSGRGDRQVARVTPSKLPNGRAVPALLRPATDEHFMRHQTGTGA